MPKYAANVEGGGGKVLLMPSGHDTLNTGSNIEKKISESFATVSTWDGKEIYRYEALGRATQKEFEDAVKIMDEFIGRPGVFLPKVIIVDDEGRHIETTNRSNLPVHEKIKKADLLGYLIHENDMPLTNPAEIAGELDIQFRRSRFTSMQD